MNSPKYTELLSLAMHGKFSNFASIYLQYNQTEIESLGFNKIFETLADDGNLCAYGLVCFLNLKREDIYWHTQIFLMFQFSVQYLTGAYETA